MRELINGILQVIGVESLTDNEFSLISLPDNYSDLELYASIFAILFERGVSEAILSQLYFYFKAKGSSFSQISVVKSNIFLGAVVDEDYTQQTTFPNINTRPQAPIINVTLNQIPSPSVYGAPRIITEDTTENRNYILNHIDASQNNVTVQMLTAVGNAGKAYFYKAIDLTNTVKLIPATGEKIDDQDELEIVILGQGFWVYSDGSNLRIM